MVAEDNILDDEEKDNPVTPIKPWDPKLIRITTKTFTLRELYTQLIEGELDLAPDFQRSFVWKAKQQVRLIESILLGIPLPAFYFNEDGRGSHQVIDGVQRLTTVRLFMSDTLTLEEGHLEYLSQFGGSRFSTMDASVKRRFSGTQIVAHVIEPQTPDEVKFDIFNRVNTGGSPLTPQEIRHCMAKERSRFFLQKLSESPRFDEATDDLFWRNDSEGNRVRDTHRMTNREMVLRFCAFKDIDFSAYSKATSLDMFLLNYMREIDKPTSAISNDELSKMEAYFIDAMESCMMVLGDGAFRRWPLGSGRRGPINRAVFESQALALAEFPLSQLILNAPVIKNAFRALFDNVEYDTAVRAATGDVRRIESRLRLTKEAVRNILQ